MLRRMQPYEDMKKAISKWGTTNGKVWYWKISNVQERGKKCNLDEFVTLEWVEIKLRREIM